MSLPPNSRICALSTLVLVAQPRRTLRFRRSQSPQIPPMSEREYGAKQPPFFVLRFITRSDVGVCSMAGVM